MPIFISYSRQDGEFVDKLAENLVRERHNVWLDRWELNVGDSLIKKIQSALTESSAILVILSKSSVASVWVKKELNSGLMRELEEKKVLVLPCIIEDCEIPLFLREKVYADFRKDSDDALRQVNEALLRIPRPLLRRSIRRPFRRLAQRSAAWPKSATLSDSANGGKSVIDRLASARTRRPVQP